MTSGLTDPSRRSRRRIFIELAGAYGLILLILWTPNPWHRWLYPAALLWMAAFTILSFDGWKPMGLSAAGFRRGLWVAGVALLITVCVTGTALLLHRLHTAHQPAPFVKGILGYGVWALMQQFLLQDFVLLRLLKLLPHRRAAILTAAGLFAVAHLPNPVLTPLTLIWGAISCWLFLRYRNLYTLAIAHALLGLCVASTVPNRIDHHMRAGLGYFTWHPHPRPHRSHSDHVVSTRA